MRIAVAGLHTECSTYNPVLAREADFRVLRGPAMLKDAYFDFLTHFPAEFVTILHARAIAGGPVERGIYQTWKAEIIEGLRAALPLDGVYLAMHGAAPEDGLTDADIQAATATLIEPGKLTVCTTLPFEPFQSDQDGEIVGFDVDMVDLVAARLGVEQSIIDTPFEGIKSGEATNSGKCDAAAAGMSITPEREEVMNFSVPYFDANFALVTPKGSGVTGLEDLKGKKVAGQASTTGLDFLNEHQAEYGYEIVEYTGFDLQSQALLTGQVDGALNDTPVFKKLLEENPDAIEIVKEYESGDSYGVGMKKGNDALTKVFDAVFTASKTNGQYKAIYEKWIGPYSG